MKKTQKFIILILLSLLGPASCIHDGPINNSDFGQITSIRDIEGRYQNLGEGSPSSIPIYLSHIVWPNDKVIDHKSIDAIDVKVVNPDRLLVTAFSGDVMIKQKEFVEGVDFKLQSGRLQLGGKMRGVNDNVAGVGHEKSEIGLDQRGQGKYRDSAVFGGIALLIPIMVGGHSDVRFPKITP